MGTILAGLVAIGILAVVIIIAAQSGGGRSPVNGFGSNDGGWPAANALTPAQAREKQRQAARDTDRPKTMTIDLGRGVTMRMVLIPPGTFAMGSPASEKDRDDDETQHLVRITKAFYLGAYEVTQPGYEAVAGNARSSFKGARNPAEMISWNDAVAFCHKASHLSGRRVRLPTEAEWEYACRAGTGTRFHSGTRDTDLNPVGWYRSNSGGKTHPIAAKKPNAWGLYDMHGNVWEWCSDWYGKYNAGVQVDPKGVANGRDRVLRGGSWLDTPWYCRCAIRLGRTPGFRGDYLGFRVAADVQ